MSIIVRCDHDAVEFPTHKSVLLDPQSPSVVHDLLSVIAFSPTHILRTTEANIVLARQAAAATDVDFFK